MKAALTLALAGLLVATVSFLGVSLVLADDTPAKTDNQPAATPDVPKPAAPAPDTAKPAAPAPDAPKTDAPKPDAPKTDAPKPDAPKPEAAKPDAAKPDAKKDPAAEQPKPVVVEPYEKKIVEIEKEVDNAKKAQDKIPEMESKIGDQIGKMKDGSGKPVQQANLRGDLLHKSMTPNATLYQSLKLSLIKQYQVSMGHLNKAYAACQNLATLKTADDGLKKRGESITAKTKEMMVAALAKMAGIYDSIGDLDTELACFKQVLGLDKNNSAALQFVKDFAKLKKDAAASPSSSGTYSGYSTKPY